MNKLLKNPTVIKAIDNGGTWGVVLNGSEEKVLDACSVILANVYFTLLERHGEDEAKEMMDTVIENAEDYLKQEEYNVKIH